MSERRDHQGIEELLSASVLGALEPEEQEALEQEMRSHGPRCPECMELRRDYGEVAGRLAFALEPVAVRPGLEDETVRLARGAKTSSVVQLPVRRNRSRVWRSLVAVAAALVLFAGGWLARDLSIGNNGTVTLPTARVVSFQGTGGNLSVAFEPGTRGVYLLGSDLAAPPSGKVYEVWKIEAGTPVRGACFRPTANGSFFRFLDTDISATQVMAVTVEPATCSSAPTSEPFLTATITQA
jgi:anti-sigma-K factor RskA